MWHPLSCDLPCSWYRQVTESPVDEIANLEIATEVLGSNACTGQKGCLINDSYLHVGVAYGELSYHRAANFVCPHVRYFKSLWNRHQLGGTMGFVSHLKNGSSYLKLGFSQKFEFVVCSNEVYPKQPCSGLTQYWRISKDSFPSIR